MAELKLPRLLGAAKEFNIGQDTLIDFLIGKGFDKEDLKATSKLTENMYRALQQEFQSDKVAKLKSDQIDLPKGGVPAEKKKKDEKEITFKKDEKAAPVESKPAKKEEAPVAPVIAEQEPEPVQELPIEKEETPAVIKVEAPEIEAPKVIDKIDLSAIDSSTRPKKGAKKKSDKEEKAAEEKPEEIVAEKKKETQEEKEVPAPKEEPVTDDEQPAVIENIKADKIEGPKILGKIDLPVDNDTRPKKDEKRKRKRIPIEKKPDDRTKREGFFNKDNRGTQGTPGTQGGTQQGGGNRFQRPQQDNRRGGPGHAGGGTGGRRDIRIRREEKQIDEKEIQNKIQETMAKLSGGGSKGKNLKAKIRRDRRNQLAEAGEAVEDSKLQLTEFISVSELANLMDVSFADVISKCMGLGIMVSINQRLDAEVIELVASEFGHDVEFIDMEKQMEMEEEEEDDNEEDLKPRSPIVTIMGHVDHGKTSLLDYIRSANVVAGEAGGITQHIGAYQVELPNGKEITFLDTPGHEAFTAMRARGAKATDIAVIVIAADDAVMPQTREAISHAQAAQVPMIFAINKIDKDGANSKKIYEQLSQMNILVEEWGGKYQSQEISAKKGWNVDKLLEKI